MPTDPSAPRRPLSPLAANGGDPHSATSAWADVVLFGGFCFVAGYGASSAAESLDTGRSVWSHLFSALLFLGWAVWVARRLRRRLRAAEAAHTAAAGDPALAGGGGS